MRRERRSARRKQREIGINTTVSWDIQGNPQTSHRSLTLSRPGIRGHPPILFNRSLLYHLEVVKNPTDPWLLFLYELLFDDFATGFMPASRQKRPFPFASQQKRRSDREYHLVDRWVSVELVRMGSVRTVYRRWRRGWPIRTTIYGHD